MLETNKIYNGNCLDVLKTFEDNCIDSCVTDPPYGISFMNKHWDYQIPSIEIWEQVLRVLKPGGHLLCACGTRTQHRMVCNIEDAGFEIRDVISWIYASGFPKSLNVNKNLDGKVCECKKEISRQQEAKHDLRSMWKSDISKEINFDDKQGEVLQSGLQEQGSHSTMQGANANKGNEDGKESSMEGRGNDVQKEGELQEHKIYQSDRLDNSDGKERRVHNGTQIDNGENVPEIIDTDRSGASCRPQPNKQQQGEFGTIPNELNTQENGTWETCNRCGKPILPDGIGTALKPATEFWTLARKPIEENTIAENVLKYGTGGLNIDGSRISTDDSLQGGGSTTIVPDGWDRPYRHDEKVIAQKKITDAEKLQKAEGLGRFPANVIFDEFTGKILDEQSIENGIHSAGKARIKTVESEYNASSYDFSGERQMNRYEDDSIGASRFFYCPKADNFERNKGLKGFDIKEANTYGDFEGTPEHGAKKNITRQNNHPTVKPIDLMRYLVKLITPKHGICIDPFCGSGTTLIGCKLELIKYIGIDTNEEYCKIAEARVAAWNPQKYIEQTLF